MLFLCDTKRPQEITIYTRIYSMKKLVLSISALAVTGALVTPKLVANKIENNINNLVADINAVHGYKATLVSLSPSWFATEGSINITIDPEAFGPKDMDEIDQLNATFEFDASHGPILTKGDNLFGLVSMEVKLADAGLRDLLDWSTDQSLYSAQLHGTFLGSLSYQDRIQPFTVKTEEKADIAFEGYQGSGSFENNEWAYLGTSKPVTVKSEKGDLTVGEIDLDIKANATFAEMLETSLYDSDNKINLRTLVFSDKTSDTKVQLDNFYLAALSAVDADKGVANVGITYGLDALTANDFTAKDLALSLEINNISNAFLEAYKNAAPEFSKGSTEQVQAKMQQFFENNLLAVVAAEPQINITSLRGTLAEGSFESKVNTSLVGIKQLPQMLQDPNFWLSHVLANGEIAGDKAVIEHLASLIMVNQLQTNPQTMGMTQEEIEQIAKQQVPQMIQTFMQQGFIVANETSYTSKFAFKDKALTINDKQIPLPL